MKPYQVDEDEEQFYTSKTFDFEEAIKKLKLNQFVARVGWKKGIYLYLQPEYIHKEIYYSSCINMCTSQGVYKLEWSDFTTDMLANDWILVTP